MAVDEISSNERVGSPDVKSLMCIIHFQHGGPKAVNTVDEVGGGGGGPSQYTDHSCLPSV